MTRPASRTRPAGPTLLVFAALALSGCHSQVWPPDDLERFENGLFVYVGGDGKLVLDQIPTTDSYTVDANLASGASKTLDSWQGRPPAVYVLPAATSLEKTYYLNLSKYIVGTFYFSNTPSQTQKSTPMLDGGLDGGRLRMELLVGDALVAGTEFPMSPFQYTTSCCGFLGQTLQPGWNYLPFQARAEVSKLPQGSELSLRITRWGGLGDLILGTTGDHASHVELRYYDVDPLGGVLYLENGQLVSSVTGGTLVDETPGRAALPDLPELPATTPPAADTPDPPVLFPTGLPLLGLLAAATPAGRRNRLRSLAAAAAILALPLLAGCTTGPAPDLEAEPTDPQGPVQTKSVEDEVLKEKGIGAVRGTVLNDDIVPVAVSGADVIILKTEHFRTTDKRGRFDFPAVEAGAHLLRFQAVGYDSVQSTVDVEVGKILTLNVTLHRLVDTSSDAHKHPLWGDKTTHVAYEKDFLPIAGSSEIPGTGLKAGNEQVRDGTWYCSPLYSDVMFMVGSGGAFGDDAAANSHYCSFEVPLEETTVIWPGTGMVEVTVTWTGTDQAPKELGLSVATPIFNEDFLAGASGYPNLDPFVARASGASYRIAMFPSEADPGHATRTRWQFSLHTPLFEFFAPGQLPVWTITNVRVTITIHKSVVPFEPPHPDMWGGSDEIKIASSAGPQRYDVACPVWDAEYQQDSTAPTFPYEGCRWKGGPKTQEFAPGPHWYYNSTLKKHMNKILPVPPGTKSLRGTMNWNENTPAAIDWRLAYRPANRTYDATDPTYIPATMGERGPLSVDFTIDLAPDQTDWFYSQWTNWKFFPDDGLSGPAALLPGATDSFTGEETAYWRFTLDLWAVKDPTYGGD